MLLSAAAVGDETGTTNKTQQKPCGAYREREKRAKGGAGVGQPGTEMEGEQVGGVPLKEESLHMLTESLHYLYPQNTGPFELSICLNVSVHTLTVAQGWGNTKHPQFYQWVKSCKRYLGMAEGLGQ